MNKTDLSNTITRPSGGCDALIKRCVANHAPEELALGWMRHEAVFGFKPNDEMTSTLKTPNHAHQNEH